jgi:hypothetical protein
MYLVGRQAYALWAEIYFPTNSFVCFRRLTPPLPHKTFVVFQPQGDLVKFTSFFFIGHAVGAIGDAQRLVSGVTVGGRPEGGGGG